jgi:ATP-dependent helicase/nuclease subunit B
MPVELLVSPPGSGKTDYCLQRIREMQVERPFAPLWVVLPDDLQIVAFRQRLAQAGGAIGVQVGTFGDLYRELLEKARKPVPLAPKQMVHRFVLSALTEVYGSGELQHYASLRDTPGFPLVLREAFTELKQALVYPQTFTDQVSAGSQAQQEMARLYQAYQSSLQNLNWEDSDGLGWLAVDVLQQNPTLLPSLELLVIDGFDSFSQSQRRAICQLESTSAHLLITLPGEFPFRRAAHRRFEAAFRDLAACLSLNVNSLPTRGFLPASIQQLEAGLFEPDAGPIFVEEAINLVEARSPAEEAREALRWLKARVLRDGVPLRSCAVVTPNPDLYHPFLRQAAAEFGLPLRFTQGEVLARSPAIAALLYLLNLPVLNYPRRSVLDAIRSPYFDLSVFGLDARQADILDEVSRFGQVIEGRDQWEEVFDRLVQSGRAVPIDEEDEFEAPHLPDSEQAVQFRLAFNHFCERLENAGTKQLLEWVRWLEDLLDEWRYFELGLGDRDQTAFEGLRQILSALILGENVIGPQVVDYPRFVQELQGALEGSGYQEPLPRDQPAALVLRVLEARGVRYQAVAILGLAEGIFPAVERADPFLDEGLRESLGLESRLQREQAGLFYQCLLRSDRFLLLTRPYLAEDGERWEPSPYWKEVQRLLPDGSVQTIRPDDPRPLNEAASPEEALFWAVRQRSLPKLFSDLLPRWDYLRHAREVLFARQAGQASGPYEGCMESLSGAMAARYPQDHIWSASRLEAYAVCPHQFFARNALDLEAKTSPEPGLNSAQLGSILHKVLERAYSRSENPADPQQVLAVLPEIARQVFYDAPLEYVFRPSPLWQVEQEQLLRVLETTVRLMSEESPDWRPIEFELSFGMPGSPPLAILLEGHTILLHGIIDRLDRSPDGYLRVIDYKTGGSHLAKQDLIQGRRLQLPLYALAAQVALGKGEVSEGLYWALMAGKASSLKLSSFTTGEARGPNAAISVLINHLNRILPGIHQAYFPPVPPKGGCPPYCPASSWCWRFTPGWGA